ncbi:SUKH-4 family immunity protein [Streptomyces lydicus]|uniref:SUKH-4 family immunity protein n=1 Tax=Streptomyces lydicus TaxID=47763 RepID=UPI0037A84793
MLLHGAARRAFQGFDDNENEQQLAGSRPRFLTVPGHYWLVRSSNVTTAGERRDARPSRQAWAAATGMIVNSSDQHAATRLQDAVTVISEWWQERPPGGRPAYVLDPSGTDGASSLQEAHRRIEGSVLVDAQGLTAEEVHQEVLVALGVDFSPGSRIRWRSSVRQLTERRLVLVTNAHRAGRTRRSYEPERLISRTVPGLNSGNVTVLAHTAPRDLPARSEVLLRLPESETEEGPESPLLRALALAEPRHVPMRIWAELASALTGESVAETALTQLVDDRSDLIQLGPNGVAFLDEGVAERLRKEATAEEIAQVGRHFVDWLQRTAHEFRHSGGWARSGPEGRYAAAGLAAHAVQAGALEELFPRGDVLANIPQTALMDAACCAFGGHVPGNSAAGDGIHLWSYGVVPPSQSEWAALMHLMATARQDTAFASAVAGSGVELPWKTAWTHWRPPGGYHVSYTQPMVLTALAEVRWDGRPAVAGLCERKRPDAAIWDAETGELLAGPWQGDEIPEGHLDALSWPPPADAGSPDEAGRRPGPRTFHDLYDGVPAGRSAHRTLLESPPLPVGDLVILGGSGGLFALEPRAGEEFSGFGSGAAEPLSGPYAAVGPTAPVGAQPPSPQDLIPLYGEGEIFELDEEEVPDDLTDEAARHTLLEFGLPDMREFGMGLYPYGDSRFDVMDEVFWPDDVPPVQETGPFFQIGFWMGGELVVDGPTGHVLRIPTEPDEDHLAGLPAACSVERFLTMVGLWVTGLRIKQTIHHDLEAVLLPQYVAHAQASVDSTGAEAPAWSYVFHNE